MESTVLLGKKAFFVGLLDWNQKKGKDSIDQVCLFPMIDHETSVDSRHYCLIFAAATLGKLNGVVF